MIAAAEVRGETGYANSKYGRVAWGLSVERKARIDRLWERWCEAMVLQGLSTAKHLATVTAFEARRNTMMGALKRGRPAGFRFASALEAADVGAWDWQPRGMPEPTHAPVGSAEKIAVLSQRLADGLELFHPDDNRVAYGMEIEG